MTKLCIGIICALSVGACASTANLSADDAQRMLQSRPNTIEAAILYGVQQEEYYLDRGRSVLSNRTNINWLILASNIFVTAAAGLDAHPDSIFLGSLVGLSARSADPVVNPGGGESWSVAYGASSCLVGIAQSATTSEMMAYRRILDGYSGDDEDALAGVSALASLPGFLTHQFNEVRHHYLRASIPDVLNLNDIATEAIRTADSKSQVDAQEEMLLQVYTTRSLSLESLQIAELRNLRADAAPAAGRAIVAVANTIHIGSAACLRPLTDADEGGDDAGDDTEPTD